MALNAHGHRANSFKHVQVAIGCGPAPELDGAQDQQSPSLECANCPHRSQPGARREYRISGISLSTTLVHGTELTRQEHRRWRATSSESDADKRCYAHMKI